MLHGNSSSSLIYEPVFDSGDFSQTLISFDFMGHGQSPWLPQNEAYSIDNYLKQVTNLISQLEGDIYLVGHSLGGHIAIEIAPKIQNLKGLFVFGTPPVRKPLNFGEAFNPVEIVGIMYSDSATNEQIDLLFDTFTKDKSFNNILISDYKGTDPRVRTDLAAQIQNPDSLLDEVDILKSLTCKKVVVYANYDPAINVDYLRRIKTEAGFDFYEVDNSGHYLSLENSVEFLCILKEYVS
jgi:pimeloyl-ACP methyl ester carboxylesterase